MNKKGASYQHKLTVFKEHIDVLNHVNNVVYVQWVNDIAEKHWSILTNEAINKKYFWVLLKHEIDYLGQAILGDELTIKTQVGETSGVKSIRYVEIYKDKKLIIKSQTTWCLIDVNTLKPTRIQKDILDTLNNSD
ncbi:acyl-CoA thioesterase [Flaviramulus sp. BrNp1-15]|uniref:acyl-CoA thioesterase n=1 Tax=Flaviramulus sp. BrNp1-15 TaxID=2916754 RepID=UPI001EE90818|nr:thioesterase family protein [Flaviramulus sp. BrNp1-15]ULC58233.1 acyl-CoA thioesterase [Flaviramulus sp. BrNp1-15]